MIETILGWIAVVAIGGAVLGLFALLVMGIILFTKELKK